MIQQLQYVNVKGADRRQLHSDFCQKIGKLGHPAPRIVLCQNPTPCIALTFGVPPFKIPSNALHLACTSNCTMDTISVSGNDRIGSPATALRESPPYTWPDLPGDDWKRPWGRALWPSKGQAAGQEGSWIATWDYNLDQDDDVVDDDLDEGDDDSDVDNDICAEANKQICLF